MALLKSIKFASLKGRVHDAISLACCLEEEWSSKLAELPGNDEASEELYNIKWAIRHLANAKEYLGKIKI